MSFKFFRNLFLRMFVFLLALFWVNGVASAAISSPDIIMLTNSERARLGLSQLTGNAVLTQAAELKAADMAARGYFSHNTPEGKTPWSFMDKAGYKYTIAGENLAVDFFDSGAVIEAWLDSPGHRANIVNPNYTEIGLAYQRGVYRGRETIFVVQMFGVPIRSENITNNMQIINSQVSPLPVENVVNQNFNVGREIVPTVLSERDTDKKIGIVYVDEPSLNHNKSQTGEPVPFKSVNVNKVSEKKVLEETFKITKITDEFISPNLVETLDVKNTAVQREFDSTSSLFKHGNKKETLAKRFMYQLERYISKISYFWSGLLVAKK